MFHLKNYKTHATSRQTVIVIPSNRRKVMAEIPKINTHHINENGMYLKKIYNSNRLDFLDTFRFMT